MSYSNLGNSYFAIGRFEDSVASHDRAIAIDPLYTHSYALRAISLPYLGRCDEAVRDIARSNELATTGHADDYATVYVNLALAHLSSLYYHCPAQFDAAEALKFAEVAHENRRERTQRVLAHALYRSGRLAEAKRSFEAAFEEKEGRDVWFVYAACLWRLGEKNRARELFHRSTRWMAEHKPNPPSHTPQRREAAELMGISDSD
jgi:tetratricopeptide (TPR) repeat protein